MTLTRNQSNLSTPHFSPPSRKLEWLPTTRIDLAADATWVMPAPLWRDVRGHLAGFVELALDYVATTSGPLEIIVQTAVVLSHDSTAWVTAAALSIPASTVASGGGILPIPLGQNIADGGRHPLLGFARIIVRTSGGAATANIRTALILKQPCAFTALDWYSGYIETDSDHPFILPLDLAADTSGHLQAFCAVQFNHDPNVTVSYAPLAALQGTPAINSRVWPTLTSPLAPDNSTQVFTLRRGSEPAASGLLRLVVGNAEDESSVGFLQTWLLLKQT